MRHAGRELGNNKAVADGKECAENPAEHGLGPAHSADDKRQSDEWPYSHHVKHVEQDGSAQTHGADQLAFCFRLGDGHRLLLVMASLAASIFAGNALSSSCL